MRRAQTPVDTRKLERHVRAPRPSQDETGHLHTPTAARGGALTQSLDGGHSSRGCEVPSTFSSGSRPAGATCTGPSFDLLCTPPQPPRPCQNLALARVCYKRVHEIRPPGGGKRSLMSSAKSAGTPQVYVMPQPAAAEELLKKEMGSDRVHITPERLSPRAEKVTKRKTSPVLSRQRSAAADRRGSAFQFVRLCC